MHAILLTQDLLLGSQISGAARAANCELSEVASASHLLELIAGKPASHIVIDLTCPGVRAGLGDLVSKLKTMAPPPQIIAYGPHVQAGALADATAAGCDRVLTRGQLHRELDQLFG